MRGHSLQLEGLHRSQEKVTQDLFVLVCHNKVTPLGEGLRSLWFVYSVGNII